MALNFPNSPTVGQIYTDTTSGFSYEWDGTVWKSFAAASTANIKIIDDISASFNGSLQTFALTSNSVAVSPGTSQSLIVNLGGVVQDPSDDYSVSGSNITFTTAPATGLSFSAVSLGPAVSVTNNVASVYVRQTYAATAGQTSFTFINGYTSGYLDVYQNGVRLSSGSDFTATNGSTFVLTNAATLNDEIEAIGYQVSQVVSNVGALTNLNVSGISTLSGATYTSNINSTGIVTATSFVGNVTGTATGLSGTPNITVGSVASGNINSSGILTATAAIVGSAVTIRATGINATGVITATSFVGSGSSLTGLTGKAAAMAIVFGG